MTRTYLPIAVACLLAVFFIAERFFPLRRARAPLLLRLLINIAMSGLAFATAMAVVIPSASGTLAWTLRQSFGLVPLVPAPASVRFLVGFLLLDLAFYYWHVINHKVPFL